MVRFAVTLLAALSLLPLSVEAGTVHALIFPDKSAAVLLVAALFYFGFKWRAR
ncbi:MAG TPA: hypothetical protein VF773_19885 [Verrucomicrobiae bacterium]